MSAKGKQIHEGCALEKDGVVLTLTGDPSLDFSAHAAVRNGQPSEPATSAVGGKLKWSSSDGRSGSCSVDLAAKTNFTAKTHTVAGSFCGHAVNEVTTWR